MHLLFTPSEAPLSSILQNWKKLLIFHYCLAKERTNFECVILIFHTLNYHTMGIVQGERKDLLLGTAHNAGSF